MVAFLTCHWVNPFGKVSKLLATLAVIFLEMLQDIGTPLKNCYWLLAAL